MKKRYSLLLFLLFVGFPTGWAQTNKMDSLTRILKKAKTDQEKGTILNELSFETYYLGNISDAIKYAKEAIEINENSKNNTVLFNANFNLGLCYSAVGNYNESLESFILSLKFSEKLKDKKKAAAIYMNLGILYFELKEYLMALKYYQKGLTLFEAMDNKKDAGYVLNNIGSVYLEQNEWDNALQYFLKAMTYLEKSGDEKGIARSYSNMAETYHKRGDLSNALSYNLKALKIEEKLDDTYTVAQLCNSIGFVQMDLKKNQEAKKYFLRAETLAHNLSALKIRMMSYSGLAKADSSLGKYKTAQAYYTMYKTMQDSILSREQAAQKIRQELEERYEKAHERDSVLHEKEKEMRAEMLKREIELRRRRMGVNAEEKKEEPVSLEDQTIGLVTLGIVILVVIFLLYLKASRRKKRE